MKIHKKEIVSVLFLFLIISIILLFLSVEPTITGMVTSSIEEYVLGEIPEQEAKVGEEFAVKIIPNFSGEVRYSDDTSLFSIDHDGVIRFTPEKKDVGEHYVAIIIKDEKYETEWQIVKFTIGE